MKKIVTSILLATAVFSIHEVAAQEYPVGTPSITDCGGFLVDPGLSASDYSPNTTALSVICSDATVAGPVNLDFSFFNLGLGDQLVIFDGSDQTATLVGTFTGTDLNGVTITSTNPSNCLTVLFTSDADASVGSFGAEISCGIPCDPPVVNVTANQPDWAPIRLCRGETVTLDASSTQFFNGSTIGNFTWDFDDGTTDNSSWPIVTHSFSEPGAYMVELMLADNNNCASINLPDVLILVDTEPTISLVADDYQACLGQEINLTPTIVPTPWSALPTANFGGALFIPDDQSQCFSDTLLFGGFSAGQTIQSETDLESFFINFEHSFMGDLVISFECPNGQSLIVHQQGGGGTFLGEPVDIMGPSDPPGVGYDYWWSPTATAGTWSANSGGTLPSGTYNSVQPFSNLVGCPLNGSWIVEVCDMWGSDDGWIFDWTVNFNPDLYPPLMSFTPVFGMNCDSLSWTGNGLAAPTPDCVNAIVNPNAAGDYEFIFAATDDFGCTYTDTISVNYFAPPTVNVGEDLPYCLTPVNLTSTVGNQVNGIIYVYQWTVTSANGGTISPSNIPFPSFSGATGTSDVMLSVYPINDPQCTVSDVVSLITPPTPATAPLTVDSICMGENLVLYAPFTQNGYTYQWSLGNNPIQGANAASLATDVPIVFVPYQYAVTISEPVCNFSSTSPFEITSLPCDVFLPNILTINSADSLNNHLDFGDALVYYQSAKVRVYNRWGDLVYENDNYLNNWSPTDFAEGVYYYILNVITPAGKSEEYPGYFHLMKP